LFEFYLRSQSSSVEEAVRQAEIEVQTALSTGKQVNVPLDNHFVMISNGFVPDIETEPVLTLIDEESILHIGHSEHNTVSLTITPGIYEFSVLPRGLQPPSQRPEWS